MTREFTQVAETVAQVIVDELDLPDEVKLVPPAKLGGIAGALCLLGRADQVCITHFLQEGRSISLIAFCSSLLSTPRISTAVMSGP